MYRVGMDKGMVKGITLAAFLFSGASISHAESIIAQMDDYPVRKVPPAGVEYIYHQGLMHPMHYWWSQSPSKKGGWDYYTPVAHAYQPVPVVIREAALKPRITALSPKPRSAKFVKDHRGRGSIAPSSGLLMKTKVDTLAPPARAPRMMPTPVQTPFVSRMDQVAAQEKALATYYTSSKAQRASNRRAQSVSQNQQAATANPGGVTPQQGGASETGAPTPQTDTVQPEPMMPQGAQNSKYQPLPLGGGAPMQSAYHVPQPTLESSGKTWSGTASSLASKSVSQPRYVVKGASMSISQRGAAMPLKKEDHLWRAESEKPVQWLAEGEKVSAGSTTAVAESSAISEVWF
ncbi:hypothetical protein ACQZV8_09195 [Magnetococcales bacterium HHB-1]